MYILILVFPFFSSITSIFISKLINKNYTCFLSCFFIFISFLLSVNYFIKSLIYGTNVYYNIANWINNGILKVDFSFIIDNLTANILCVVISVSFVVHIYSILYIKEDPYLLKFISYLSLFTFFILILIIADNLILIFIGWEGVGLCSYLLINFWFTRIQANKAAIKAILINRVGDFSLVIAIFCIFWKTGSTNYSTIFSLISKFNNEICYIFNYCNLTIKTVDIISFFLLFGAIGKSAQIGLHTWLPDAIEGPTPVSALIHAATIVTAGIFLIIRCSPIFEYSQNILSLITIVGSITAFIAASIGAIQNDLKKVIAYSTCSQLGYMIFSCGLSAYNIGFFHLANHAFFKALLFLTAGGIIHSINDEQDIRKIGGLIKIIPLSYILIIAGSLALIGFPFLSGFYSKEIIIEIAYSSFKVTGHFAFFIGSIAALLTSFYSIKAIYLCFLCSPRGFKKNYENSSEIDFYIYTPLILLFFGSLFYGYFTKDFIVGIGSHFFSTSIFKHPFNIDSTIFEYIPIYIKLLPLFFSILGMILAILIYRYNYFYIDLLKIKKPSNYIMGFKILNKKWFFDKILNISISQVIFNYSYTNIYKKIDKGFLELFGPFGISNYIFKKSKMINNIQNSEIYCYLLLFFTSIVIIITAKELISILNLTLVLKQIIQLNTIFIILIYCIL